MSFVKVMPTNDLWIGEMVGVVVRGIPVLLIRDQQGIYAYVDECCHQKVRLSEGHLKGHVLTCRAHQWQYDARTGSSLNPRTEHLKVLEVRIEDQAICVNIDGGPS